MFINKCLIILIIALVLNENFIHCGYANTARNLCPRNCHCDLYENHNRADCRARRLISPNIDVPAIVEFLDLSYNEITVLDTQCFQHLQYMYKLNLAHNAIHTIELDVFAPLKYLANLDLSYNRLEYLDAGLVETNTELQYLNLEGNKFMSLPVAPLLRSTSVRQLSLRNAHISDLNLELFIAMPILQQLDLAQNMINHFEAAAFNAAHQLQHVNLEENPLICDRALRQALAILEKRRIVVQVDECRAQIPGQQQQEQQSDRMHMQESEEHTEPTLIDDIWQVPKHGNDNDRTADKLVLAGSTTCNATSNELCRRYQHCLSHVFQLQASKVERQPIPDDEPRFTLSDLKFAAIMGAGIGAIFVFILGTCVYWCHAVCGKRDKRMPTGDRDSLPSDALLPANAMPTPIVMAAARPQPTAPTAPPRQPRRNRRGRAPAPPPPHHGQLVAMRDSNDNFISRLFGRPARHQYYRTIENNAATLIRTISRSNLFTNRDRERERDREASTSPMPSAPSSPDIVENPSRSAPQAQFFVEREGGSAQSEPSTSRTRPETPPPQYVDIVKQCDGKH